LEASFGMAEQAAEKRRTMGESQKEKHASWATQLVRFQTDKRPSVWRTALAKPGSGAHFYTRFGAYPTWHTI
jgi:hypothetical protein